MRHIVQKEDSVPDLLFDGLCCAMARDFVALEDVQVSCFPDVVYPSGEDGIRNMCMGLVTFG